MPQTERYEMLVLGSGEGGKFLAWHMARSVHRAAVVKRKLIGGSCPNTNCLPSKNEIWSAKVADLVRQADRFGRLTGSTATDMKRVLARKRDMVDGLIAMHLDHYKASGAELIMGTGSFIAPKTIEVKLNGGGTRVLTGDRVALNLGTHATIPDIPGLAAAAPLTNVEALELDRLPDHSLVRLLLEYRTVEFSIAAVYPHRRHLAAKVRRFIDSLVERFAEQPWHSVAAGSDS